jgi:hypothetical protein
MTHTYFSAPAAACPSSVSANSSVSADNDDFTEIFFSSLNAATTYAKNQSPKVDLCALYNMGTSLNGSSARTMRLNLTPREMEVCAMHFVDGRPQSIIAQWLGLTLQCVKKCMACAILKHPELKTLRASKRPRVRNFCDLTAEDRGPFNPDEL